MTQIHVRGRAACRGPDIGLTRPSAQITNYSRDDLLNRMVLGVVNFPPRQIVRSKYRHHAIARRRSHAASIAMRDASALAHFAPAYRPGVAQPVDFAVCRGQVALELCDFEL